ncbi:MAG: hypothetical protein QXN59_00300 [Candidatus Micrarchaeaceae archaeon]
MQCDNKSMLERLILIAATFIVAFALPTAAQASSTGVATIHLNNTHASMYLNSSEIFGYTVTLYNGTAGETYLGIGSSTALTSNGIYTGLDPAAGVPPFNGTLYVKILYNATPGNYTVPIGSVGADPSNHGIAVLYLTVLPTTKPITTTTIKPVTNATTSTAPTTTIPRTTAPTTTVPGTVSSTISQSFITPSPIDLYLIIIVVVIVVVVIALYVLIRGRS